MRKEFLYSHLPVALQNLACTYYGWREKKVRMGADFQRYYEFLLSTERASWSEIKEYQDKHVAELIADSYLNVPYYKSLMDDHGLKPKDVTTREALGELPVLRKEDVFRYSKDLLSLAPLQSGLRQARPVALMVRR